MTHNDSPFHLGATATTSVEHYKAGVALLRESHDPSYQDGDGALIRWATAHLAAAQAGMMARLMIDDLGEDDPDRAAWLEALGLPSDAEVEVAGE